MLIYKAKSAKVQRNTAVNTKLGKNCSISAVIYVIAA